MNIAAPNDWTFFRDDHERCYHARLASAAEIAQHDWLDPARLPPDCFFYAISRIRRDDPPLRLQMLFVVLEPQVDMDEADCMAAWHSAKDTLVAAHVERARQ